jgi:DNA-binding transcriptional LysR family regulator
MIELKELQLLTALARHQHFAKAAAECGMSQPAFSMRIRNLEDRLGLSIVRRANRFQGLTEEGLMIVRRGRSILDDARALEQEIAASRGEVTGTLVLGVIPTATAWAAQLVDQVRQRYPRILTQLEATTSLAIQQRLYDGTIDAGITYADSMGRDLVTVRPLYDESYVLLAPEAMVAGRDGSITWAEAAELPLSLLNQQMQNRRILDRIFADLGCKPEIVSESNGFMASMVLALEGSAAAILPRALTQALGKLGGTCVLDLVEPEQNRQICLATLDRSPELTTIQALKSVVATFVEGDATQITR